MPGRAPETGSETIITAAFSSLPGCDVQDADADSLVPGGHSLLATELAAQLSRQVAYQVTLGQVIVASTVAKLAAIINAEEDNTRRMGSETILPSCEGNGPTLLYFHPASGFAWQFSMLSCYLDPQRSITGIQSPRPNGPVQTIVNLDKVCKARLATLLGQRPHGPYYLLRYSLGDTLVQGTTARLCVRSEQVVFPGLLNI